MIFCFYVNEFLSQLVEKLENQTMLPKVAMPSPVCLQHSQKQTRMRVSWRKDDSEERRDWSGLFKNSNQIRLCEEE